jgi:hypothetical protein
VITNLEDAITLLQQDGLEPKENEVNSDLSKRFIELNKIRSRELKEANAIDEEVFQLKMQEAQLVIEQLTWLTSLSENVVKTTRGLIKTENELQ